MALTGQETIPEDDYMFLACGSGIDGQCGGEAVGVAKASESHEVRCCSWVPNRYGWIKGTGCNNWHDSELIGTNGDQDRAFNDGESECFHAATYAEAQQICAANSAFICSRAQVLSQCARGESVVCIAFLSSTVQPKFLTFNLTSNFS